MTVALINESSVVTDAELDAIAEACAHQLRYHFAPIWHRSSAHVERMTLAAAQDAGATLCHVRDTVPVAGALGYHDDQGRPELWIAAKTGDQYGAPVSRTISHEILEWAGDPECSRGDQRVNGDWYALELCDAVESDAAGYTIPTSAGPVVAVSNFVTPAWFGAQDSGSAGGVYDYGRKLTRPFELMPGGYVSIWPLGATQWTQKQMQDGRLVPVPLDPSDPRFARLRLRAARNTPATPA